MSKAVRGEPSAISCKPRAIVCDQGAVNKVSKAVREEPGEPGKM